MKLQRLNERFFVNKTCYLTMAELLLPEGFKQSYEKTSCFFDIRFFVCLQRQ
jgi:hypothetical protein